MSAAVIENGAAILILHGDKANYFGTYLGVPTSLSTPKSPS
jgi:hypothetical protein